MVTSGLDSHMIRNWTHLTTIEMGTSLRWLPRTLVGWLFRVLRGCYPILLISDCYLSNNYINDDDLIILIIILHLIKGLEYFTHYSNKLFK